MYINALYIIIHIVHVHKNENIRLIMLTFKFCIIFLTVFYNNI